MSCEICKQLEEAVKKLFRERKTYLASRSGLESDVEHYKELNRLNAADKQAWDDWRAHANHCAS